MYYHRQNPHGGDIYGRAVRLDFSASVSPLGTPQSVQDAVREALPDLWRYPDPYCRELVREAARAESVREEDILFGNGASELISCFFAAFCPKTLLLPVPAFAGYREASAAEIRGYALKESLDFSLDRGFLNFLMRDAGEGSAVILCTPNNPTGRLIPGALLTEILTLLREKNVPVLVDECFLDFTDASAESLVHRIDMYPNLFVLRAFTKNFGMAGLRLGALFSSDHAALAEMASLQPPWNVSLPAQKAGAAALRDRAFPDRVRAVVRRERAFLTDALQGLPFVDRVIPSDANFILFHGPSDLDGRLLERGIAIRAFDSRDGLSKGWYRTAVRSHAENEELLRVLRSLYESI